MDRVPVIRRAVAPLLVGSQTIPIIAIAPLVVVWFGFGFLPKILVVVLVTFFPVTVALLDGFASTPDDRTELMRSMGASDDQVFRKLRWPTGLPSLFTGLRIAATYAVVAAVIAEYVGATEGLGIWMQLSQRSFRTDLVFAAILLTAVLSIALVALVDDRGTSGHPVVAAARDARRARAPAPRSPEGPPVASADRPAGRSAGRRDALHGPEHNARSHALRPIRHRQETPK